MAIMKQIELQDTIWEDDRGWGIDPIRSVGISKESLGDMHLVSIKPGAVRGNHYHAKAIEWILVLAGQVKIVWRSLNEDSIHEVTVNSEPAMFEFPPNVEHAVLNVSDMDAYLLSFSNSYERGTVRSPLL